MYLKKKYIIFLVCYAAIAIAIPFCVEWLFEIGETHPMIYTSYSKGEVLSYIAAALGVGISLLAIVFSLSSQETHLSVNHSVYRNPSEKDLLIEIHNDSLFDCEILDFGIVNKKSKYVFYSLADTRPFTIKAKMRYEIHLSDEVLYNILVFVGQGGLMYFDKEKKTTVFKVKHTKELLFALKLSSNQIQFYPATNLYERIKEISPNTQFSDFE